jgi:hypothetical protein
MQGEPSIILNSRNTKEIDMTDQANTTVAFKLAMDENVEVSIDVASLPEEVQRRLQMSAARAYVQGRCNVANVRYNKLMKAHEADPTVDKPTKPDFAALAAAAKKDLIENNMRERGDGTARKTREAKDPVDAIVTQTVVRSLFEARRKKDPSLKYTTITKEVGGSGIAYLTARAEAKAAGDEKVLEQLTKDIQTKYVKPAQKMLASVGDSDDGDDLL